MVTAPVVAPSSVREETAPVSRRFLSIDVFRGLCVAGMILVTNPGTYSYVYWPLLHAAWNGVTPTDMIFPSFLFLAGVSMTFSFAARQRREESSPQTVRHIFVRCISLILLGLALNCFDLLRLPNLRLPGVLQRIGLCYLFGGLFYLALRGKQAAVRIGSLAGAILILLAVYWLLQTLVPVPGYGVGRLDQEGNFGAYIDRAVFGIQHLWHWGGQMWDPEGLLSTLPAICNLLLGIVAGEWLGRLSKPNREGDSAPMSKSGSKSSSKSWSKVLGLAVSGILLMGIAVALNPVIPINKKIWTPSFMLLSGGFSLLALGLLHWLLDGKYGPRWRWAVTPALVYGSNAILGFSLANVLGPLFGELQIPMPDGSFGGPSAYVYQHLLPWMNPWNASLGYALLFVALNAAILWPLYRRRIFLRL
jgi:predicted acyltransferase